MGKKRVETLLPYVYFDGEICPKEEANVSIGSTSLQYGINCFGGMRAYIFGEEMRFFRIKDHFERLMRACKILGFPFEMELETFRKILFDLTRKNAPTTDVYLRPFIFSNDELLPPRLTGLTFDLAVYLLPFNVYFPHENGLRMMVSSWRKIPDNVMSTKAKAGGAYLNSALATTEAIANGYDEALVLDDNGHLAEAAVANAFVVYRGEVFVPPIGSPMLEGVTYRTVMTLLEEMGYTVRREQVDRSMLYTCDELFLTGTAAQVIFANSVDGRIVGDGQMGRVARALREHYLGILAKEHPLHEEWIESINLNDT